MQISPIRYGELLAKSLPKLLKRPVQDYDDKIELPEVPPHEMVQFLMDRKGLRQADLVPVLG
jgi:hypothetical protein